MDQPTPSRRSFDSVNNNINNTLGVIKSSSARNLSLPASDLASSLFVTPPSINYTPGKTNNDQPKRKDRKSFSWTIGDSNSLGWNSSELTMLMAKSKHLDSDFVSVFDILMDSLRESMNQSQNQIPSETPQAGERSGNPTPTIMTKHSCAMKTLLVIDHSSPYRKALHDTLSKRGHTISECLPDKIINANLLDSYSLIILEEKVAKAKDSTKEQKENGKDEENIHSNNSGNNNNSNVNINSNGISNSNPLNPMNISNGKINGNTPVENFDVLELCRKIRGVLGEFVVILVLTPRTRPQDLITLLDAGANDYINTHTVNHGKNSHDSVKDQSSGQSSDSFRAADNFSNNNNSPNFNNSPQSSIRSSSVSSTSSSSMGYTAGSTHTLIPPDPVLLDVRLMCAERQMIECSRLRQAEETRVVTRTLVSCIEYAADLVEIWDAYGNIQYVNYAVASSTGFSRWELLGKEFTVLIDNTEVVNGMWTVLKQGKSWLGLVVSRHHNGALIYYETSVSPVSVDGLKTVLYYTAIKRDVTQRKREEDARGLETEKSIEKSRMRLSMMSHDIRSSMSGIIGMSDLLAETSLTAQQHHFVEIIRNSSNSLLTIINDILDISKIEAGKLQVEQIDFDLKECVEDVVELMAERAQTRGLELGCFIKPEVPTKVIGDSGRLKQILTNLIGNAVKFTEHGEVVVLVSPIEITPTSTFLRLEVRDTGIGIKNEAIPLLFKAFTQAEGSTARQYGGSGLGLAICKELVKLAFNGEIDVVSEYGKGTTFWITLHFERQRKENRIGEGEGMGGWRGDIESFHKLHDIRVLYIDQSETLRGFMAEQLTVWGMRIDTLPEGGSKALEVLKKAKRDGFDYNLVIIDYNTPLVNGLELATRIRSDPELLGSSPANSSNLNLSILLVVPLKSRHSIENEARGAGIQEVMAKPIRQTYLSECLINLLQLNNGVQQVHKLKRSDSGGRGVDSEGEFSMRVLVVDDNVVNQQVALRMLQKLGCEVEVAGSGQEALNMMSKNAYSMVFLDVMMPVMDGFQVSKEIRRRESGWFGHSLISSDPESGIGITHLSISDNSIPNINNNNEPILSNVLNKSGPHNHIPVIAMTANAFKEDEAKCLNAGMDAYLSKPIKIAELRSVIGKWSNQIKENLKPLPPLTPSISPSQSPIPSPPPPPNLTANFATHLTQNHNNFGSTQNFTQNTTPPPSPLLVNTLIPIPQKQLLPIPE
eukprot:TRINITY_DN4141_c0_g1_i4.p1 TRINITY_DN4141_c0_g1~~TRINITY_DN4141_c0_g1_i4.p1  ORF type:complete len:1220 (-),score=281.12 TRINITY_DN4141_c0_g1_i4:139-3798(-)